MCGFCAVFVDVPHWTEGATHAGDGDDTRPTHVRPLAHRRRQALINAVFAHFGCHVDDWMGGALMVSSQRGRTEIVDALPGVWTAAESMAGRAIDPLDPELIARRRAAGRTP